MKKITLFFIGALILNFIIVGQALCGDKELSRIQKCEEVLSAIMEGNLGTAPKHLLCHSKGIVIVPSVKKVAFIFGARRGKGIILIKKDGEWLPPSFLTISGGSFGLQAGAKSTDILLLIMSDKAINKFKGNKLKLGVDLGVTAGPVGKEVIDISSENLYKTDIFSYVKERGMFAGVNLSGSVITHDNDSNKRFYGEELTLADILDEKVKNIPESITRLLNTLKNYCSSKK
jgi:lipid-binding SYLF domain-containing protein